VEGEQLVIRNARHPRAGWAESFQEMAAAGEDILTDDYPLTEFDEKEWEWK
jgi:hypothetical protein